LQLLGVFCRGNSGYCSPYSSLKTLALTNLYLAEPSLTPLLLSLHLLAEFCWVALGLLQPLITGCYSHFFTPRPASIRLSSTSPSLFQALALSPLHFPFLPEPIPLPASRSGLYLALFAALTKGCHSPCYLAAACYPPDCTWLVRSSEPAKFEHPNALFSSRFWKQAIYSLYL